MLLFEFCLLVFGTCSWESPPSYLNKFLKSCTCFVFFIVGLSWWSTFYLRPLRQFSCHILTIWNLPPIVDQHLVCRSMWRVLDHNDFTIFWKRVAFEEYACAKYSHIFSWRPPVVSDNLYTKVYSLYIFLVRKVGRGFLKRDRCGFFT